MRHLRFAATATCAVLCGLLSACTGGGPAPVAGPTTAPAVSPSTDPSSAPSVKTAPVSSLCEAFDLPAAQTVSASLQAAPRAAADQGTTTDACGYASADGSALLTLAPAMRPYDQELTLARTLAGDPAASGMRDVRVNEVSGIGQAAFSESGFVLQQHQNVAYVVWRSGSRVWVLTLAEVATTNNAGRLGAVAEQLVPRLPR
jgi:hypothetical protein